MNEEHKKMLISFARAKVINLMVEATELLRSIDAEDYQAIELRFNSEDVHMERLLTD